MTPARSIVLNDGSLFVSNPRYYFHFYWPRHRVPLQAGRGRAFDLAIDRQLD